MLADQARQLELHAQDLIKGVHMCCKRVALCLLRQGSCQHYTPTRKHLLHAELNLCISHFAQVPAGKLQAEDWISV